MLFKKIYGTFLKLLSALFGVGFAKKFDTKLRFKRNLNLKEPKTLADKVSYLELYAQNDLASKCTDKFAVREYVKQKGLEHILVPAVGGPWSRAEDVDFTLLPDSFVLKATHGCKMNYIVPHKTDFDEKKCITEMKKWLSTTYGTYSVEPHYAKIPHRIYAEEYLGDISNLIDYKFHCLNGVPSFVLATSGRKIGENGTMQVTLDLFDMAWKPIYEVVGFKSEVPGDGSVPKPECFDEMVAISKALAGDFEFVRVDLYALNGKVYFGELTFSPACCVFPYISEQYLHETGKMLNIDVRK